ncbi:MAG: 2-C-methyl-D-erythritol 4-phosphate cytidylyltransferase [Bacteroidaceae bacterium]|nr:2-C-methyl-D-erythritol 4-phosphate cytidylyltransferase [Bacteroidaceae bacterium]
MKSKDLIIANIKAALNKKNISQRQFADMLNKNEVAVSRWLSGRVGISSTSIIAINEVLGMDITIDPNANAGLKRTKTGQDVVSKNYAIILAGGVGSRVGADRPKQFVEILGKPVLAYTIEAYQNHPEIDGIEVVCVKSHVDYLKEMVSKYNYNKVKWICLGGATFQDSVYNGVQNLDGEINGRDVVMIHYGAAPFTSAKIISDAIRVCHEKGNAVSATPCFQLMGSNDGNDMSRNWVDRDKYVQIACPQCFKFNYIQQLYEEAIDKNLLSKVEPHTTSLMYLMGRTLHLSYGDQSNVKITTKEDLDLFEGYVLMKLHKEGKIKVEQ